MTYIPSQRNWDNIQFTKLRKIVDPKFNDIHDELSDCFYNGKPFRTYGVLVKEQFDKLHGLIFLMRDVEFHQKNLEQPADERIPESEYNDIFDRDGKVIDKKDLESLKRITDLKLEGFELTI